MRSAAVLAACMLAAATVRAEGWQAELGAGVEHLTGGRPDWRQLDAALRYGFAPRAIVELSARRTERFELRDDEFGVAVAAPIAGAWSGSVTLLSSPTHRNLPHGSVAAQLQRALVGGWVVGGGLKHTRYDDDSTLGLSLGVDRYVGAWRVAGAWLHTRVDSDGTTTDALRLQLDRYIGEQHRIGVIVSGGQEVEDLAVAELRISEVDTIALVGRWRLTPRWAVVGDIGTTRVGSRYRRSGGRLGAQCHF
jgi:YaiO family outer membrane protein